MRLYLGKNIPAGGIDRLTQAPRAKSRPVQNSSFKNFVTRKLAP